MTTSAPVPHASNSDDRKRRSRIKRLLTTEIQFVASPVFQQWREELPPEIQDKQWERLDSTTWLSAPEELLWFRWMNYKKYRANQWRGRLSPENACNEAMDRVDCLLADAIEIRNRLALVYQRLGAGLAANFLNPHFPMDELVSEANTILLKCIEMFDADRGFRFSTYATHSIRRHLCRYVKQRQKRAVTASPELLEATPDEGRWSYDHEQRVAAAFAQVESMLDQLGDREEFIVRARYGLGERLKAQTLQAIADELGVSRERVRQIEQRALGKLSRMAKEAKLGEPS